MKSTDSIDGAIRQGEPPYRPAAEGQEASAKRPWLTRRRLIITTLSLPLLAIAWWFSAYPRETRDGPRGWYYAGSNLKDDEALGGFGPCDNFPKKCAKDGPGKVGDISLVAFPDEIVDFRNRKTVVIRVINRTDKTAAFSACDSSLYIVQEALDSEGQWKPLERFPDTFCGNSFHRVFLEANEHWEFFAISRSGRFKTKLRFRLEPGGENGIAAGGGALFSNEYEGSVDPSEFVRAAPRE